MAVLKQREARDLPLDELEKKLAQVQAEIDEEKKNEARSKRPANPGKYRELRKARARLNYLITQKTPKEKVKTK
jgi:large subunit ribosomal protein L29